MIDLVEIGYYCGVTFAIASLAAVVSLLYQKRNADKIKQEMVSDAIARYLEDHFDEIDVDEIVRNQHGDKIDSF